ncbi:DsbA family oxidoreductase [Clostridium sp.]|uniref:DsbA family oxidoreductase n=1 Tax=Clostridium sp. TaxID=1506 RepID=UPI00262A6DAF|nr:DsbA family oxidoreductase [Clostridium sp.]
MKVEIWSDIFCPFCYIGKRKFELALKEFDKKEEVEVIYRSFELNPNAPKSYDKNIHELIASKYGITYEEAKLNNDNIVKQAKGLGLEYNFDTLIVTNSFDAHRMIHFSDKYGKMQEMTEALFKAYFTESKDVSDFNTLVGIAISIGLNKDEALNMLNCNDYKDSVRKDEEMAGHYGISSVPFFIFNDKFSVSGAQPTEMFLMALNKSMEDEKSFIDLNKKNSEDSEENKNVCVDGSCKI